MTDKETDGVPATIRVQAIDVVPYAYSVWCSFRDGKPFANQIVHRQWSDDGRSIWFGLDSHNSLNASPDEELELIQNPMPSHRTPEVIADEAHRFAESRIKRERTCPTCGHTKA